MVAVKRLRMAITVGRGEGSSVIVEAPVREGVGMKPATDLVGAGQARGVRLLVQFVPKLVDGEEALAVIDVEAGAGIIEIITRGAIGIRIAQPIGGGISGVNAAEKRPMRIGIETQSDARRRVGIVGRGTLLPIMAGQP